MRSLLRGGKRFQITFQRICLLIVLTGFTTAIQGANFYWVGGSGSWKNFNQHWATTSGGQVFYDHEPTQQDDVFFDANSFTAASQVVTLDGGVYFCKNMNWTGVKFNPTFLADYSSPAITLKIYGSLTAVRSMKWLFYHTISFESTEKNNLIVSPPTGAPNYNFVKAAIFNGVGGEWILGDSLNISRVELNNGTFRSNNYKLNCSESFTATNYAGCYLGTSAIKTGTYTAYLPTGAVMDADSTNITVNSDFKAYGVQQYNDVTLLNYYESIQANNCRFHYVTAVTGPFYLAGTGNVVDFFLGKGSSTIYYTNTIKKAEFRNDVFLLDGSTTFDTVILNNPNKVVTLAANTTQYINGTIITIPSTCSDGNIKIVSKTTGTQATISKTSGSVNCSNLVLQDIKAIGGATFTAVNSVLVSNVTGWTIMEPSPRSVYWVGGTGNWSDAGHWSLTSGGTGGACLPTVKDDVIFDSKSFTAVNQKVTVDQEQASCNSLLFAGVLFNPTVLSSTANINLNVYGNYTLTQNMSWLFTGTINFKSQITGNTINTAKQALSKIKCDGTGSWILQDSLKATSIEVTNGSFNTNGKLVRCSGDFTGTSSFVRSVILGNSTVFCTLFEFAGFNMTLQSGNSTIYTKRVSGRSMKLNNVVLYLPTGTSSWEIVSLGGEKMEYDSVITHATAYIDSPDRALKINYLLFKKQGSVSYGSTIGTLEAQNTVDLDGALDLRIGTLYLNNPGFISTIYGTVNISNQLIANGSCTGGYITLQSKWASSTAYISKPSGVVNCDRIILKDVTAQGGATFNATNAVNGGNVNGWNFGGVAARTLYWVGNSGNWSSPAHWSSVSGGTGGACPPTLNDHVIFDNNSFSADAIINADVEAISCKNMLWQNYLQTATFSGSSGSLSVYGSFRLNPKVNWDYTGQLKLVGDGRGKEVATASCALHDIVFEGPGSEWLLNDSLTCDNLTLANGRVRCSSSFYTLRCSQQMTVYDTDTLELGNASVYAFYWTNHINPAFSNASLFDAGTSTIHCYQFNGYNQNYYKLNLTSTFGYGIFISTRCTFKDATFSSNEIEFYQCSNNAFEKARFTGNVSLKGNATFRNAIFNGNLVMNDTNVFDTLAFNNPSKTVTFVSGRVQTVKKSFNINSFAQNKINLKSTSAGLTATLAIPPADSCFDHLTMQDMVIASNSKFHAGSHSINLGNNSNCVFTDCISPLSKVWPGDTNNDTLVDCKDLLNIGLAYGERGPVRANASLSWSPQPALDWNTIFGNFVNVKHADCDGNGIVDSLDLEAVRLNYSKTRPAQRDEHPVQNQKTFVTHMDLSMENVLASYPSGTTVNIPVILKPTLNPSTQVYGVAFDMEYNKDFIQDGSVSLTYENSWLVPSGNRIQLQKDFYADETHMVAFSRINKTSTAGNGIVTWLHFKIKSNVSGMFPISIGNVRAVDASGADVSVRIIPPTVTPGVVSRPNSFGAVVAYIVIEDSQNITLSPLATSTTCPGNTMNIGYTASGAFDSSNVFTAELSDSSGSFDHPTIIGTSSSLTAMNVTIPSGSVTSRFYRIRITSSSPAFMSEASGNMAIGTVPAIPAAISGLSNVCAVKGNATVIDYSIQPVTGADSYNWIAPANASIISGQGTETISVIYAAGFTSGMISVSAINSCGTSSSRSLEIGILTPAPLAINGPVNACPFINSGINAAYSIAPVGNASSYQWTVPSGASIVSGQGTTTLTVKFTTAFSAGNIGVSSKSACGSSSAKTLAISKLVPAVPASITGPLNVCSFVGTSTAAVYTIDEVANAVSYSWTVPANAIITSGQGSKMITVTFSNAFTGGNLGVKAVASCASSVAKTIKLIKTIPATPGAINGPTNACPFIGSGTPAVYSVAAVAGADSYIWTVPANASIVSGQGSTQLTVSYAGNFTTGTITVKAVVNCGNSGARSLTISKTIPAIPASITGPANVCAYAGSTSNASYTTRAVAGALSYNWTVPANASIVSGQGTTQISVNYSNSFSSGNISVQSVVSCGSSDARTFAVVKTIPAAPVAITGPVNACSYIGTKNNASYSIAAIADASSYEWAVPANAIIVSGQGKTRIVVKFTNGFTTGIISVRSIAPCGSSNTTALQVNDCSNTPRIAVDEFTAGMLVSDVYPNPSHTIANLEIESDHAAELQVDVSDFTGKLLTTKTTPVETGRNTIAAYITEYTPGIYFIRISNKETGETLTRKVIKQ